MSEEHESERRGRERPSNAADRRGRRAAPVPTGASAGKGRATPVRDGRREEKVSLPRRLERFLREVVAELRKVIWPTRQQMITYTIVVLIFVSFMVALVAGLDILFSAGVAAVFGS